ncbi:unnamed protein product, partial [Mesorhabditis belari]|uniref:Serpentine Receptor, class H n=1 Tax=Mesorhabditis belari TaxID=2138241 RepID=A0AAF3EJ27_9BILA
MTRVGLSTEFLTVLGMSVLGHTQTCTVFLFLLRLQFIVPMGHPLKMKTALKYAFFLLLNIAPYLHCLWYLPVVFNHDNKQATNDYYRQKYPELLQFIELDNFLGSAPEMNFFFLYNICSFLAICGTLMISLSCLCFYFLRIQEEYLEKRLIHEERKLIKALITQITIPMITVIIPFFLGTAVIILDQTKYTKYCALIGLCVSQHGLANTLAILLLYRPYRKHLKATLRKLSKWIRVDSIVEKWLGPKVSPLWVTAFLAQQSASNS